MRIFFLVLWWAGFLLPNPLFCQKTFSKMFSNYPLNSECIWNVTEMQDGFITVSVHDCFGQNINTCAVVSKLDSLGNILWFKEFEFYPTSNFGSLFFRNDKIYISGSTNKGEQQLSVICLDLEGNLIWTKDFGSPNTWEAGGSLLFTKNNQILVCGTREPINTPPLHLVYLITLDSNWEILSEKTFDFQNKEIIPTNIIETTNGQRIFSYISCPIACATDFNAGIASIDTLEKLLWNTPFPLAFQPDRCHSIQIDSNTIVANYNKDTLTSNYVQTPPIFLYQDLTGKIVGEYIFMNKNYKQILGLCPVWEKGFVGVGHYYIDYFTNPNPLLAGWIFRFDEKRDLMWEKSYADTSFKGDDFYLHNTIATSDGGFLAVGNGVNKMTGVLERHNWLLKLDSMGCLEPNCGATNYITTATSEPVFLKGIGIKIFPNPTSDFVNVEFPESLKLEGLQLFLLSNTGKTLKKVPINERKMRIDLPDIPAGMYFLTVLRGNEVITSSRIVVSK
jgi:Secretion system C-terminal sorting domain